MAALAFKPWAHDQVETDSLKEVLGRVNLERGHFRDITEASLQEEIAGEGGLELSESESDDVDDEPEDGEPAKTKPRTREELFMIKREMSQQLGSAHNDVLMALDLISFLLTREDPRAVQTVSQSLKASVPMGTLATDVWQNMPRDKARDAQDELVATNVRMEGLQHSANGLLAAANKLADNVRKETQYWDQVLSITEKGWNICKIPNQSHRLGVTFGFNESASDFSRRGIAALNTTADGDLALERGIGIKPKALRVQIRRDNDVLGCSRTPSLPNEAETTLEARIRHARDSLFDEELFHEMLRESRGQASLGVTTRDDAICFASQQADLGVQFELITLEDIDHLAQEARQLDGFAQATAIAARLLLGQAHKERLKRRSEVPRPLSERKDERIVLPILRPIVAFVLHKSAVGSTNSYIDTLTNLLSAAGIEHNVELATVDVSARDVGNTDSLVRTFMETWRSRASLTIHQSGQLCSLKIALETTLAGGFGTVFTFEDTEGKQTHRFDSLEALRAACDAALASNLAALLRSSDRDESWRLDRREALLTRVAGGVKKNSIIWLIVDSASGVLSMNATEKKVSWSLREADSSNGTLDGAWEEMAA